MDQSIGLNMSDRRRGVENLSRFVAASIGLGRASDTPFYHLVFDRVFPDDVYNAMLTAMPVASDYRPMSGRSKGQDLERRHPYPRQDRPVPRIHPRPAAGEARGLGHGRVARSARTR